MNHKETIFRDYEWVLRVISSCNTVNQWEGAQNCYNLWLNKHSRGDNKDILSLSGELNLSLSSKLKNLLYESRFK